MDAPRGDRPSLSVVLPAFNEERRLAASLEALDRFLDDRFPDAEVIVADDGSTDSTAAVAAAHAARSPRTRLLRLPHRGKGHAVREGMLQATGAVRAFMDVDLAVPPDALTEAVARTAESDVVIGSREAAGAVRMGEPPVRRIAGRLFNLAVRRLAGVQYRDTQCGFKAFTAQAAEALFPRQRSSGFGFDAELLHVAKKRGLTVYELPVQWRYGEDSSVRWRHPPRMLLEVAAVRWRSLRGAYG